MPKFPRAELEDAFRRAVGAQPTDDVEAEVKKLQARNVTCRPIVQERWGRRSSLRLPSGLELGFYQPSHPTALKR